MPRVFQVGEGCCQVHLSALADRCATGQLEAGQIDALRVADGKLCQNEHCILVVLVLRAERSAAELYAASRGRGTGAELVMANRLIAEFPRRQRRIARTV